MNLGIKELMAVIIAIIFGLGIVENAQGTGGIIETLNGKIEAEIETIDN